MSVVFWVAGLDGLLGLIPYSSRSSVAPSGRLLARSARRQRRQERRHDYQRGYLRNFWKHISDLHVILIRPPRGESTLGRLAIRITSDGVHFQLHSCHTRLVPRIEDVTLRTFAELLTAYMDRTGIGDAELARRIPVSRPTLVRWKEGVTARPRYRDDVLRCAELLRLSPEERDEFLLAAGFSPETAVPADQAEAVSEQVEFTADSALAPVGEDGDSEDAAPPTVHAEDPDSGALVRRRRVRIAIGVGIAALAIVVVAALAVFGLVRRDDGDGYPAAMPGESLIVLAPFVNYTAGQQGFNVLGRLRDEIDREIAASGLSDARSAQWPTSIFTPEEAESVAVRSGATIVIWGEYDSGRVMARFTTPGSRTASRDDRVVDIASTPDELPAAINAGSAGGGARRRAADARTAISGARQARRRQESSDTGAGAPAVRPAHAGEPEVPAWTRLPGRGAGGLRRSDMAIHADSRGDARFGRSLQQQGARLPVQEQGGRRRPRRRGPHTGRFPRTERRRLVPEPRRSPHRARLRRRPCPCPRRAGRSAGAAPGLRRRARQPRRRVPLPRRPPATWTSRSTQSPPRCP